MPKLSQKRLAQVQRLQQLLRVLNGEYGWGELKAYYLATYTTAMQVRHPELTSADVHYPTDEDFQQAADVLRNILQRWAADWLAHPPRRKQYDFEAHLEQNAGLLQEFLETVKELPKETVLTLFVPGLPCETPGVKPLGERRRITRRIKNQLPRGARLGKLKLQGYVNDLLAAMQFDDPLQMSKAIAVELFRTLVRSGIRLGQCRMPSCNHYFLNLSGVTEFCSRKHAQATVNQRRKQKREEKIPKVIEAIKEYERLGRSGKDWKRWVAARAHVTRHWVTLLVNESVVVPPARAGDPERDSEPPEIPRSGLERLANGHASPVATTIRRRGPNPT